MFVCLFFLFCFCDSIFFFFFVFFFDRYVVCVFFCLF